MFPNKVNPTGNYGIISALISLVAMKFSNIFDRQPWSIKKIYASGLPGNRTIQWQLNPGVNILGGPNGSGKSTLLRSIYLLFHQPDEAENEQFLRCVQNQFDYIRADFANGSNSELKREVEAGEVSSHLKRHTSETRTHKSLVKQISLSVRKRVRTDTPDSNVEVLYINTADQMATSALKAMKEIAELTEPTVTFVDLLIARELKKRNELFLQKMLVAQADEIQSLRKPFDDVVDTILQYFENYSLPDSKAITEMQFCLKHNNQTTIGYDKLSTGERQLLYLFLTVGNTLGKPTILLLDEADLGMHIDWKEHLLSDLMKLNPNMQIITATHSPSMVKEWMGAVSHIDNLTI